jgi:hypothetical protein
VFVIGCIHIYVQYLMIDMFSLFNETAEYHSAKLYDAEAYVWCFSIANNIPCLGTPPSNF